MPVTTWRFIVFGQKNLDAGHLGLLGVRTVDSLQFPRSIQALPWKWGELMLWNLALFLQMTSHRFPASTSGYQPLNQFNFPGYQPMYTPQSSVPSSTPSLSSLSPPRSQYSPLAATSNMGAMPHLVGNSQVWLNLY